MWWLFLILGFILGVAVMVAVILIVGGEDPRPGYIQDLLYYRALKEERDLDKEKR